MRDTETDSVMEVTVRLIVWDLLVLLDLAAAMVVMGECFTTDMLAFYNGIQLD